MEGTCKWCGIKGYMLCECMRQAPVLAHENKKDIPTLSAKVSAKDTSFAVAKEIARKVNTLLNPHVESGCRSCYEADLQ